MEEESDCTRETQDKCVSSPSVTDSGQVDEDDIGKVDNEQKTEVDPRKALKVMLSRQDAQTNTVNTGDTQLVLNCWSHLIP